MSQITGIGEWGLGIGDWGLGIEELRYLFIYLLSVLVYAVDDD
ncbi:MAG: hypothetical protein V7L11_10605 [Nostoc sp.]